MQFTFDSFELKSVIDDLVRQVDQFDYTEALEIIGNVAVLAAFDRIETTKLDPDGVAWRPWSPGYAAQVAASGNAAHTLLRKTGDLGRKIDASVTGPDEVTIFAELPYANRHQQDRAYLGLSAKEEDDAAEILAQHVADFLSEAA